MSTEATWTVKKQSISGDKEVYLNSCLQLYETMNEELLLQNMENIILKYLMILTLQEIVDQTLVQKASNAMSMKNSC